MLAPKESHLSVGCCQTSVIVTSENPAVCPTITPRDVTRYAAIVTRRAVQDKHQSLVISLLYSWPLTLKNPSRDDKWNPFSSKVPLFVALPAFDAALSPKLQLRYIYLYVGLIVSLHDRLCCLIDGVIRCDYTTGGWLICYCSDDIHDVGTRTLCNYHVHTQARTHGHTQTRARTHTHTQIHTHIHCDTHTHCVHDRRVFKWSLV